MRINCVTFPLPGEGPEQQLLKPNEWSYCDYFWADRKDPQGTTHVTGFEVLLQKQLKGKQLQKEMAEFIHERIKIEEEYAKNLSKLSLSPLAAQEEGTLGEAWTQLKKSLHDEAEVHLKFSNKLHTEVEKPLLTFRGDNFKKDLKKYDHHIADLRKQLASRFASVEKVNTLQKPQKAVCLHQRDDTTMTASKTPTVKAQFCVSSSHLLNQLMNGSCFCFSLFIFVASCGGWQPYVAPVISTSRRRKESSTSR
ncbi:Growth arrest-specific protein 7 [Ilyodon furcidens]|uniref:Growth arrest-specific protein 7 n=1 Tax=Ilyodon furcidens TaxID=33524 RepID=A0ABV0SVM1_9TELE